MEEINNKRTLNSKHYKLDDRNINGHFHVGHIHYFNKLGVGNSKDDFRSLDWTLNWDDIKKGWYFNYHSFHPFLPEYADGWVEFRDVFDGKDQTIKYRAKAFRVKGRLVMPKEINLENETDVNCVIYDDAFGIGKDYILYFTRSELKKVVRIRDGYKKGEERFTWDIDFPNKKIYRAEDKQSVETELGVKSIVETTKAYKLDIAKSKIFDSSKQLLIGNSLLDGKEWFTYIKSFKVWDSGEIGKKKSEVINVEFDAVNKTITKIVPVGFIENSVGDVFTDTTTSYYCSSDGRLYNSYAKYSGVALATLVASSTGATNDTGEIRVGMLHDEAAGDKWRQVQRAWFVMDTSGITSGATISAASLFVVSNGKAMAEDLGCEINVYDFNPDVYTAVDSGDLHNFASTALCDTNLDFASIPASGTSVEWVFNASGIAAISKTSYSAFGLRDAIGDVTGSGISGSASGNVNEWYIRNTATAGTASDPYLSVTYSTVSGPANLKTWNGLAKASVKTMNGLAIASVKTWNGLA
jgi:hypothetical protein